MVSRPECRRNGGHGTSELATCQYMTGSVHCTEMLSVGIHQSTCSCVCVIVCMDLRARVVNAAVQFCICLSLIRRIVLGICACSATNADSVCLIVMKCQY